MSSQYINIGSGPILVPSAANLPASAPNGSLAVALDTGALYEYNANTPAWQIIGPSLSSVSWGDITGTLSNQTDLQSALNAKAPIASPTFTGTLTTPLAIFSSATATTVPYLDSGKQLTSSAVTPTELGYLAGVTSAIQTQLAAKAPIASPTFTGTLTTPLAIFSSATATTVPYLDSAKQLTSSAVTPTELGYLSGVTSALQTQLNAKSPTASPTFTGTLTAPNVIVSALTATTVPYLDASKQLASSAVTPTELGYLSGVTSALQTQLAAKAPLASPAFTTVVTIPNGSVTGSGDAQRVTPGIRFAGETGAGFAWFQDGTTQGFNVSMQQRDMMSFQIRNNDPDNRAISVLAPSGFYTDTTYPNTPLGLATSYWGEGFISSVNVKPAAHTSAVTALVLKHSALGPSQGFGIDDRTASPGNTGGYAWFLKLFTPDQLASGNAVWFQYQTSGFRAGVIRASDYNDTSGPSPFTPESLIIKGGSNDGGGSTLAAGHLFLRGGDTNATGKNGGDVILGGSTGGSGGGNPGSVYMPNTSGAPADTPNTHTGFSPFRFDPNTNTLYIYNGAAWKSVVLT